MGGCSPTPHRLPPEHWPPLCTWLHSPRQHLPGSRDSLGTRSSHQVTPPSRSCHSTASPTPTLCTRGAHGVCTRQSGMVITSAASRCQCRAPAAQVAATPGDGPVAMGSQSGSPTWTDVCQLPKILSLLTPAWVLHPAL